MNCPYCNGELTWHDYFGKLNHKSMSGIDKRGDIYKCENEECESETFNYCFHTYLPDGELKEGYPC